MTGNTESTVWNVIMNTHGCHMGIICQQNVPVSGKSHIPPFNMCWGDWAFMCAIVALVRNAKSGSETMPDI